jgi:NAD(P)-dependent dehydrogenase (short-subunit alcohol dehydrogenase family)/AcrR family transcriptional regulator
MSDIPTTVKNKGLVEKRREQIILAAIKLFSEKGFHKTTLRELAEEAGLSHGNIYDYVGSKEDIFFLIHDFLAGSAMVILNKSIESISDPIEKLRRMVGGEFNLMNQWSDALLLIYQESHILNKSFLKELLSKERAHLHMFEIAIQECIEKDLLRDCNARLIANLIKSMVDSWALKRWDLRGHASQVEMEKSILDMIFHGLSKQKEASRESREKGALSGKVAMVINGGTVLGMAVCGFLASRKIKVITHLDAYRDNREFPVIPQENHENMKLYFAGEHGPMTPDLLAKIEEEVGFPDIYIQDLGIGSTEPQPEGNGPLETGNAGSGLDANLSCAQRMAAALQQEMARRGSGRILFLAPWAWDRYAHPLHYETVKAGTMALTRALADYLAGCNVNVNCIVPGFIKTIRPSTLQKKMAERRYAEIPAGHLGEIQDVLDGILYLVSDSSRYVTGQTLTIGGGVR